MDTNVPAADNNYHQNSRVSNDGSPMNIYPPSSQFGHRQHQESQNGAGPSLPKRSRQQEDRENGQIPLDAVRPSAHFGQHQQQPRQESRPYGTINEDEQERQHHRHFDNTNRQAPWHQNDVQPSRHYAARQEYPQQQLQYRNYGENRKRQWDQGDAQRFQGFRSRTPSDRFNTDPHRARDPDNRSSREPPHSNQYTQGYRNRTPSDTRFKLNRTPDRDFQSSNERQPPHSNQYSQGYRDQTPSDRFKLNRTPDRYYHSSNERQPPHSNQYSQGFRHFPRHDHHQQRNFHQDSRSQNYRHDESQYAPRRHGDGVQPLSNYGQSRSLEPQRTFRPSSGSNSNQTSSSGFINDSSRTPVYDDAGSSSRERRDQTSSDFTGYNNRTPVHDNRLTNDNSYRTPTTEFNNFRIRTPVYDDANRNGHLLNEKRGRSPSDFNGDRNRGSMFDDRDIHYSKEKRDQASLSGFNSYRNHRPLVRANHFAKDRNDPSTSTSVYDDADCERHSSKERSGRTSSYGFNNAHHRDNLSSKERHGHSSSSGFNKDPQRTTERDNRSSKERQPPNSNQHSHRSILKPRLRSVELIPIQDDDSDRNSVEQIEHPNNSADREDDTDIEVEGAPASPPRQQQPLPVGRRSNQVAAAFEQERAQLNDCREPCIATMFQCLYNPETNDDNRRYGLTPNIYENATVIRNGNGKAAVDFMKRALKRYDDRKRS